MGDIDVLIKAEDRDKIKKLLISNGFDCVRKTGRFITMLKTVF